MALPLSPQDITQGIWNEAEKLTRFINRLTVIIHKTEEVTIVLQDPQYGSPHMLPEKLNDLMTILDSQRQQLLLINGYYQKSMN